MVKDVMKALTATIIVLMVAVCFAGAQSTDGSASEVASGGGDGPIPLSDEVNDESNGILDSIKNFFGGVGNSIANFFKGIYKSITNFFGGEDSSDTTPSKVNVSLITADGRQSFEIDSGKIIIPEETNTPSGMKFDGWYSDPRMNNPFDFNASYSNDVIIYAKYVVDSSKCIVTFVPYELKDPVVRVVSAGSKVAEPLADRIEGYSFVGWYLGNVEYDFNQPVDESIYLDARYVSVEEYRVVLDLNGGQSQQVSYEVMGGDVVGIIPNPTKDGMIFAGWYTDSNFMEEWNMETMKVLHDMRLYAKWVSGEIKDSVDYLSDLNVQENIEFVTSYSTPKEQVYIYKIATLENYTISPLSDTVKPGGKTTTLKVGSSRVSSETITNSIEKAYSCTVGTSNSVNISVGIASIFEIGGEFTWSQSTTNATTYANEVSKEVSKQSDYGIEYIIGGNDVEGYYRIAYVNTQVDVYEYIKVDSSTGIKNRSYAVVFAGENAVTLQYSKNASFSIPNEMHINSSYVGELPSIDKPGSPGNPIAIITEDDLKSIRNTSNRCYILMADIKLSNWAPFELNGELDGNGKTISGLNIRMESYKSGSVITGLFTKNNGTIKNLTLADAVIKIAPDNKGASFEPVVGFFAGINRGAIINCSVEGSSMLVHNNNIETSWISSYGQVPAMFSGDLWKKYATLEFTGKLVNEWPTNTRSVVTCGAIAGINENVVDSCSVNGNTSIEGKILDYNYEKPKGSYAELFVGGICGKNLSTVSSCSFSGNIRAALDLHDSGDGTGIGLGYSLAAWYSPSANGYCGEIVGSGYSGYDNHFNGRLSNTSCSFAPIYVMFTGAGYHENRSDTNNIHWTVSRVS